MTRVKEGWCGVGVIMPDAPQLLVNLAGASLKSTSVHQFNLLPDLGKNTLVFAGTKTSVFLPRSKKHDVQA